IHSPPKAMVEWPDAELVNARKGDWLFAHVRQPLVERPKTVLDHWMLWRGPKITAPIRGFVLTRGKPHPNGAPPFGPHHPVAGGPDRPARSPEIHLLRGPGTIPHVAVVPAGEQGHIPGPRATGGR